MTSQFNNLKPTARIAGLGYLVIFLSGIFANFMVLQKLWIPDDAAATFANFQQNQGTTNLGIFGFIVMVVFDVVLTWALYVLLKPTNKKLALFSAWFRLVNCTIFGVALINLLSVQKWVSGTELTGQFTTEQLQSMVMMDLHSFNITWLIGLIFFGVHLLALAVLLYRSVYLPSWVGILIGIAGAGYLVDSMAQLFMSDYALYADLFSMVVIIPGVVGELSLTLYLLIKGVRTNLKPIPAFS